MSQLVTIYGGSGFLGRYIARRMAKAGWRVRVACRRPNEAGFVRPYGAVGQVEPVLCNIRDDASVAAAMLGADAVVNCVGTFDEGGKNNFEAVQAEGAERVARIAAEQGVSRMVQISAIGADAESSSAYGRSKAAGEAGVLEHMPGAVILRPSVLFGAEDEFFNRFAAMARLSPVIPLIGAETKFQPVHVDDVAQAAVAGVLGKAEGTYELGGPDVHTFRELIQQMLGVIRRRKLIIGLPPFIGRMIAFFTGLGQTLSLGIVKQAITRDQIKSLETDNLPAEGAKGFDSLGIKPVSMESVLPDYLWRFRPAGQYEALKESARNLKA
ncbi:complex I NDUFA9 subunit family protein [Alphaproteobacteria bacterium KMM 3653]|uniref:Complex I NDUFA9 subunit family protein n=1 Tax=Harenicola maris TaxID=2841044 RepID=A0AAP2G7T7_9RHOB|nr:complex I NDUFA9 subunit family protein [Harenicola maris]